MEGLGFVITLPVVSALIGGAALTQGIVGEYLRNQDEAENRSLAVKIAVMVVLAIIAGSYMISKKRR